MEKENVKKNKGYKFRIKPTEEQRIYFEKAFGCTRKMYNTYVDLLYQQLEEQNFIKGKIDYKTINLPTPAKIKMNYEYMKEIDSLAFANTQLNFQDAIKNYNKDYDGNTYKKKAKKQEKTIGKELTFRDLKGMPKFKSKHKSQNSFTTNNQKGTIAIIDKCYIKIPKLKTLIKFVNHREIPKDNIIKSATISKDSRGKYYISFTVEYYEEEKIVPINNVIALDYAQKDFYVSNEGKKANYPSYYRKTEAKLKREQQKLSKKELKSNNWIKQKKKISKLQNKIARQRRDWLHKESYKLANEYDAVIVEDLNFRNLAQCLKLGKTIHDNSFGMFREFLKYKLEDRGKLFIKIDKWYPSSKTCSNCGEIKDDLKISDRIYICKKCGLEIDRDINAGINLYNEGLKQII